MNNSSPTTTHPESEPVLVVIDGRPVTTSLDVAERFGKRHDTVLRTIRNLGCSQGFTDRNFAASDYFDQTGRNLPMYHLTRDGFVFLAMGFTGRDAATWKETYIEAFNRMEIALRASNPQAKAPGNDDVPPQRRLIFDYDALGLTRSPLPIPESFRKTAPYYEEEQFRFNGHEIRVHFFGDDDAFFPRKDIYFALGYPIRSVGGQSHRMLPGGARNCSASTCPVSAR